MLPWGRRRGFRGSYSNSHSRKNDWDRVPSKYTQELDAQPWESESVPEPDNKSATMIVPKSWEGEAVVGDKSQWYGSSYDVSYNPSQHCWIPQSGWKPVQTPSERNWKRDNSWTHRELKKTPTEAREAACQQVAPPPDFQKPGKEASVEVAPRPKVPTVNEMAVVEAQPDELAAKKDVNAVQQPVKEAVEVTGESPESENIVSVMKERKMAAGTSNNTVINDSVIPPGVPLTKEATNTRIPFHSGGYPSEHKAALLQTFNDDISFASAAHGTASITMDTVKSEGDCDHRAKRLPLDAPRPSTFDKPATSSPPSQTKMTVLSRPASHEQSEAPEECSSVEGATNLEQPKTSSASQNSHLQPTKSRSSINIPGFDANKYGSPTARKSKLEDLHRDLGKTSLSTSYPNKKSSAAASNAMNDTTGTECHSLEGGQPHNGTATKSHKVEEVQPQNAAQVNDHCAQNSESPSQKCDTSIDVTTSGPQPALIPNRGRQNGVSSKAKSKTPQNIFEPQAAPETKEEILERLQQQQLTTVGYRLRHKGDRSHQSTVSLKDLELARRPLPADIVESIKEGQLSPEQYELTITPLPADPDSLRIADSWSFEKKPNAEMTNLFNADVPPQLSAGAGQDSSRVPSQDVVQPAPTKSARTKSPNHVSKKQPAPSQPDTVEGHTAVAETRQSASNLSKNKTLNSRWATPDEVRSPMWDTNSNAWGSEVPSNASVASEDSTKPMHRGKPFMNKPLADYDQSLVGWDGKMQPPPVDWNDRPNFNSNSPQFRSSLNRYLSEAGSLVISSDPDFQFEPLSTQMVQDLTLHPDGIDFVKRKSGVTINTARKYGYDMPFEHLIDEVVKDGPLRPLGDDDLMDWGKLDLSFGDNFKYKDETTNKLVDNWYAHKFGRRISPETQASKSAEDTTPSPEINRTEPVIKSRVPEIHPYSPKANIYIRPAVRTDIDQLTRIYNWYVQSSPRTTEIHVTTRDDMEGRFQDSTSSKLPWLVAVLRSHKRVREVKGRSENIVGFALATDFTNVDQAERISAELELYVDKDSLNKGVGRCLLDKLLESTDRGYLPKGGYAFTCDPSDRHCYFAGGARDLHKLVFMIRHFKYPKEKPKAVTQEDNDVTTWIVPWLEKKFDFEKEGCFKGIGAKFGRYVDLTCMGYETKWCPKEGEIPENLPGAY